MVMLVMFMPLFCPDKWMQKEMREHICSPIILCCRSPSLSSLLAAGAAALNLKLKFLVNISCSKKGLLIIKALQTTRYIRQSVCICSFLFLMEKQVSEKMLKRENNMGRRRRERFRQEKAALLVQHLMHCRD
jgi:hypothetical protein